MPAAFASGIGSLVGGMASGMSFKNALKSAAFTAVTAGATQALRGKGFLGSMSGTKQTLGEGLRSMTDPGTYKTAFNPDVQAKIANEKLINKYNQRLLGDANQGGTASDTTRANTYSNYQDAGMNEGAGAEAGERNFLQKTYDKYISPDRPSMQPDYAQASKETSAFRAGNPNVTPDMAGEYYKERVLANTPGAFTSQAPRAAVIATGVGIADKKLGTNLIFPSGVDEGTQTALGPSGEELYAQDPGMYGFDYDRFIGRNPYFAAQEGGEIVGPGTGTSDSIPALLSDGEFVVTAEAVRNAGGGDRRAGAQRMYDMMKRLEQGGTA